MRSVNPKISVIIPAFNSWKTLDGCIKSIEKQTLKPFEIIVVDNDSIDGTSKKIKAKYPKIKLVTLNENTGVTGGRNSGIKAASKLSDYLFFFDHDMVAYKNMLYELIKVSERDKSIGILTPKIYYWDERSRIWSAGTHINLFTGMVTFRGGKDVGQYEQIEEIQIAPAAMLVGCEVIDKIKRFDDIYFATYEDSDFCLRAKGKGFKVFYVPKALAFHKISPKVEDEADRLLSRAFWIGRNRVIFMRKFGRSLPFFLIFLPFFVMYYLTLALKTNRTLDWLKFLKGTIAGFFIKL